MEHLAQDNQPLQLENTPLISFEQESDTLFVENIEIRLDSQLGDDDLGVSLLVESLEQQYEEMLSDNTSQEDADDFLSLQSAKEWVSANREKMAGLFRYLKTL